MNLTNTRPILVLVCCLLSCLTLNASGYFEYSPLARKAYQQACHLQFAETERLLSQIRAEQPDNLIVHHIENYLDFFLLYIGEDKTQYQQLKKNKGLRLEALTQGDPNSPYFLYLQADILLQWSLIRLRFGDYLAAFTEVSKAHKLLLRNEEKFPNFIANKKDLGVLHAMVGTIPDSYKWGIRLLSGLQGTIAQGKKEIEEVLDYSRQHDFLFEDEATVLYAFLLLHLDNQQEAAWDAINSGHLQPEKNSLHCFVMANIAMRSGQNDKAIDILQNRPQRHVGMAIPYLDFMQGLTKLRRLDPNASQYFNTYLHDFNGQHFIKESLQKLAWQELINERPEGYLIYMNRCREEGHNIAGGDKNALKEARQQKIPNVTLIKARLLFDGAYYQQALAILEEKCEDDFPDQKDQLEYKYRLGRILHGLKDYGNAIHYYLQTIEEGKEEKYFFACNAALQIGLIYEETGNRSMARKYFNRCLDIYPDEYRTGLHQKAKSGLARLKGE